MPRPIDRNISISCRAAWNTLDDIAVGQKLEKWIEIQLLAQRIDRDRFVLTGNLDQADLWPIGVVPDELSIDGDVVDVLEAFASRYQIRSTGHYVHD